MLCHSLLLQFVLQDADMLLIFLFLLIDRILEFTGVLLYPAVSLHCSDRGSQRSVLSEHARRKPSFDLRYDPLGTISRCIVSRAERQTVKKAGYLHEVVVVFQVSGSAVDV